MVVMMILLPPCTFFYSYFLSAATFLLLFSNLLIYLPLPSFDSDGDIDSEGENPIQKFLLRDKYFFFAIGQKHVVALEEKTARRKVGFLGSLSKLFPKTDEIFDNQKI